MSKVTDAMVAAACSIWTDETSVRTLLEAALADQPALAAPPEPDVLPGLKLAEAEADKAYGEMTAQGPWDEGMRDMAARIGMRLSAEIARIEKERQS